MIKLNTLKRNAISVRASLRTESNGEVYCKVDCMYYLPKRLMGTDLLQVEVDPHKVGAFGMMVVGNEYMVFNACTILTLGPCSYDTVLVDNVECIEFAFEAKDLVFVNLTVPVINTLGYVITKELSKKAVALPWYSENDKLNIPTTLSEFTKIRTTPLPYLNLYMSYLIRDPDDLTRPYRLSDRTKPYVSIPLSAVGLTVPNTLNALGGSYLDDALMFKLVHPSEKTSPIEEILT
jgi:hypothetical protein